MTWMLFILELCGPGCVEITAREYDTRQACRRAQIIGERTIAWCEERRDG